MIALSLAIAAAGMAFSSSAQIPATAIGVVIMHGKGGSPSWYVSDLAASLEREGFVVTNREMPWSGRRSFDVNVDAAAMEVESALDSLRGKGVNRLFLAGHSYGGLFALYFAGKQSVDGVIAIAPGGDASNAIFREKLGEDVNRARKLVAEGKGDERARFTDYENSKGSYGIVTTASAYFSWFDPDGAMNQKSMIEGMIPRVPVLYIVPTGDYPGLRRLKDHFFSMLPKHPLSRLYEPSSNHVNAAAASRDEIVRWTTEVAGRGNAASQPAGAGGRP